MASVKPRCDKMDCFQNRNGRQCDLLRSRPSHPCPFYKTDAEAEAGRMAAHKKLADEGKYDLIQKYEYNPQRRGQW